MFMWSKKIRKIVDIGVLCAIGAGIIGIAGGTVLGDFVGYQQYSAEYDAQQREALDRLRDETGHIPSPLAGVDPTETTVGYTSGTKCAECGEIYKGHDEIPRLCEDYYNLEAIRSKASVSLKWTMKAEIAEQLHLGSRTYTVVYTKGFIGIGGTNYMPFEVNSLYPGLVASYDEGSSTITLNVTSSNGVTIDKALSFGGISTVKTTGGPLRIETNASADALNCESNTVDLVVENELDVFATDHLNTSTTASAIVARKISVGETGILRASNFKYAFYTRESIELKGQMDASGVTNAFYSNSSTNGGKYVEFTDGNKAYINDVAQTSVTDNQILFANAKKHLIICDENTNLENFVYFTLNGDVVEPTDSAAGSASLKCVGCGTLKKTVTLPKLNSTDYIETPTSVKVDGATKKISSYQYNIPGIHANPILIDNRDSLKEYINAGGTYYTAAGWSRLFPKAKATVSSNICTITLTGDASIGTNTTSGIEFDGLLDLTCYDKVVVKGNYALSFGFANATSGLVVNDLEIQSGTTVNIVGKAKETGLTVKGDLSVAGTLDISNYVTGLNIKNDSTSVTNSVTIASTGNLKLNASSNGFYNTTPVNFVNNGKLNITGAKIGMNIADTNSLKFSGSSETTINASNNCIRGQYDDYLGDRLGSDTRKNPKIRICDSAKFNATSTGGAGIMLFLQFIVENENGSQCNAEVNIDCAGSGAAIYGLRSGEDSSSGSDYTKVFVLNSSKQMNILGTTSSSTKGQAGLYFREKNVKIQIKSPLHIGNFAYAIRQNKIQWNSSDIVYDNSNPMITFDNYDSTTKNFYEYEAYASGYKLQDVISKFKNSSGQVITIA